MISTSFILKNAIVRTASCKSNTNTFHQAESEKNISKINEFLQNPNLLIQTDENGNTPLHRAIINHNEALAIEIIKHQSCFNIINKERKTVYGLAIEKQIHFLTHNISRNTLISMFVTKSILLKKRSSKDIL